MSAIIIRGGRPLSGSLTVQGAKNSVLPILAATLLSYQRILKGTALEKGVIRHELCRQSFYRDVQGHH